jgi:hypothetical protein
MAEMQSALAATWFDLGELARARTAYLAALKAAGPRAVVPVHDIEKLANTEARLAERQGEPALADLALMRLQTLDRVTAEAGLEVGVEGGLDGGVEGRVAGGNAAPPRSLERGSLYGSTWKIKASACAAQMEREGGGNAALRRAFIEALGESARAYAGVAGVPGQPGFEPYPALNRLMVDAVRGLADNAQVQAAAQLARDCGAEASQRVRQRKFSVWNAIMVTEAVLAEHVVDGRLAQPGSAGQEATEAVCQAYRAMFANTPIRPVERDSVLGQFRKVALLWRGLAWVAPQRAAQARLAAARLEWLGEQIGRADSDSRPPQQAPAAVQAAPASAAQRPQSPKRAKRPQGPRDPKDPRDPKGPKGPKPPKGPQSPNPPKLPQPPKRAK